MDDFSPIGLVDIRGRNNYICDLRPNDPDYTCEDGYAARCAYKGTTNCPSSAAEFKAATSKLVVSNYSKWICSRRFGTGLDHIAQVVFDEGDHAPEALADAVRIELNHREIEEDLHLKFLNGEAAKSFYSWKEWANVARIVSNAEYVRAQAKILRETNPKSSWVKHMVHMRNLNRKLSTLAVAGKLDWVVEEAKDRNGKHYGYVFDPIYPGKFAEHTILHRTPRIVVVSATVRRKSMYMLGIAKEQFSFTEYDSTFDPQRCPIYYIPTLRVDVRTDIRQLWFRLDQIARARQDLKGIVHTVSYDRQRSVLENAACAERMIYNRQGDVTTETVEQFKLAPPGTILTSPSVGRGFDFPGDECRWQFICKIPFQPPSNILKAREAADPEYRGYKAMQTMVQQFGRDMRSKDDWSQRFICDDHLKWFLPKFGHLAPRSFHRFFKEVRTLPPPRRF